MKKILVNNRDNNLADLLSSEFDFLHVDDVKDFDELDLVLYFDDNINITSFEIDKVLNIPKIGNSFRWDKVIQSYIMTIHGIRHPKTYYNTRKIRTFKSVDEFYSFYDCVDRPLIIKPSLGARSIGVKKVNFLDIENIVHSSNNKREQFLTKEIEYLKSDENTDVCGYDLVNQYSRISNMVIQDYVPFDKEFRFIFSVAGTHLGYERIKNNDSDIIGGLSFGSKVGDASYFQEYAQFKEIKEKIITMMRKYNLPWLSVDIGYVSDEDLAYVIEFQMEFAYKGFSDKTKIKQLLKTSLNYFL